jgi:hypothetical protein
MRGVLATQMSHRLSTSEAFYKNVCIPSRQAAETVTAMRSCLMEQQQQTSAAGSTSSSSSAAVSSSSSGHHRSDDKLTLPLIIPADDLFDNENDWSCLYDDSDKNDQGLLPSSTTDDRCIDAEPTADSCSLNQREQPNDYGRFDGYLFHALNTGGRSFRPEDVATLLGHQGIKDMIQRQTVDSARLRTLLAAEDSLRPLRTRYTFHQLRDRIRTAFRSTRRDR